MLQNTFNRISILLNLLKFVLWPITWCVLLSIPSALEKLILVLFGIAFYKCQLGQVWGGRNKIYIYKKRTSSLIVLLKCSIILLVLIYKFNHLLKDEGTTQYLLHPLFFLKFTSSADINNHFNLPVTSVCNSISFPILLISILSLSFP